MGLEIDAINRGQGSWFDYARRTKRPLTPEEIALANEMGIDPNMPGGTDDAPRGIETVEGGVDRWTGAGAAALDGAGVTN